MNSLKLKIKKKPYLILKVFGLIFIVFVLGTCDTGGANYYGTEPCVVYGKVTDADTQEPIEGIRICSWRSYCEYTDSLGNYNMLAVQDIIEVSFKDIDSNVNGVWLDTSIVLNTLNMSKVKSDVKLRKKL
jgi:hypothetical protein